MLKLGEVGTLDVVEGKVLISAAYKLEGKGSVKVEMDVEAAALIREIVAKTPNVFDDALAEMVIKALDAAV